MDNVKRFDKEIQKEVDEYRRIKTMQPMPNLYSVDPFYPVDPCEGDIWEMQYSAWRNSIDYPITVDKDLAFYAIIDGEKRGGTEQLINEEYKIQNCH